MMAFLGKEEEPFSQVQKVYVGRRKNMDCLRAIHTCSINILSISEFIKILSPDFQTCRRHHDMACGSTLRILGLGFILKDNLKNQLQV